MRTFYGHINDDIHLLQNCIAAYHEADFSPAHSLNDFLQEINFEGIKEILSKLELNVDNPIQKRLKFYYFVTYKREDLIEAVNKLQLDEDEAFATLLGFITVSLAPDMTLHAQDTIFNNLAKNIQKIKGFIS